MYIDNKWEILGDTSIDLTNYLTKTGDASATTAAFTAAAARALPATGESLAIIIGKVIKYLADLKDVAFSGDYNDLSNKPNSIKYHDLSVTTATATYTAEGAVLNVSLRSEEHTSELQSRGHLVCRLLLEKKKENKYYVHKQQ